MPKINKKVNLEAMPGHLARRTQQIAVALYMNEVAELNLTPVQFSALQSIYDQSGIDQKTLADRIAYDTSTIGGVLDRLELRGLVKRTISAHDARVRTLSVTPEGVKLLNSALPRVRKAQQLILSPLSAIEQAEFMRLQTLLIKAHESLPTER